MAKFEENERLSGTKSIYLCFENKTISRRIIIKERLHVYEQEDQRATPVRKVPPSIKADLL